MEKMNKTFTSSNTRQIFIDFDDFMLEKPEPLKKDIEFGAYDMGKIKGNLRRTEIYEDR